MADKNSTESSSRRKHRAPSEAGGKSASKRSRQDKETTSLPALEEGSPRLSSVSPGQTGTNTGGRSIFEPLSSHCTLAPGAWSPPRGNPLPEPGTSRQGTTSQDTALLGPQATFTPTAAGLRAPEPQALGQVQLQAMIAQAVAQFMASSVPQQPPTLPRSLPHTQSPGLMDGASSDAESTGGEPSGLIMSDDEGIPPPDPVQHVGLLDHSLFNALLLKACTTANLAQEQEAPVPDPTGGPNALYAEPVVSQSHIPCPPFFLNTVRKQWDNLGSVPTPGTIEKTLFNVAPSLATLLDVPQVDEPLNSLFANASIPGDINEALKAEDRKIEAALRKSHISAAWATKASTSMAFFARASVLWLRELQDMIPPDQIRAHQNLGKLMATSQYLADASLHTARYTARTIAADVSARRLLWLRNWRADTKAKWRLASKPYTGGLLFGAALDPYLVEGKDKRKTLVNSTKRGDRRPGAGPSQPNYRRQSFRPATTWDWGQTTRTFQRQERQQDRSAYRGRPQAQTKRPFRGAGGRTYRRGK